MFNHGSLLAVNGEHYVGSFKNNQYNGKGILSKLDGTTYVGSFLMACFQVMVF